MNAQETKDYIVKKYAVDLTKPGPYHIWCDRYVRTPQLFGELGFKRGAEIGVYRARYSNDLLTRLPGIEHLTGVDVWELYKGYKDFDKISDLEDAHKESIKTYKSHGDKATLICGWSTEVAKQFPDESLDFVFIDANHSYEHCVADIAAWAPKVRKGGIVYGHDYDDYSRHRHRWQFMNVINAVDGWVKSNKISPLFILRGNKCKSWMYVKE